MMDWDGDWGDHMDGAWGWLGGTMMIVWIVLVVLAIFALAAWLIRSSSTQDPTDNREEFRAILDRRYAAGEIDDETYRRMRDGISSGAG